MKISVDEKKLVALMQVFYSDYFETYLHQMIEGDEEKSVVTLFKGMEFFLDLQKELNINYEYENIKDFLVSEYEDGEDIYKNLKAKYDIEINEYIDKDKKFEEIFGEI